MIECCGTCKFPEMGNKLKDQYDYSLSKKRAGIPKRREWPEHDTVLLSKMDIIQLATTLLLAASKMTFEKRI